MTSQVPDCLRVRGERLTERASVGSKPLCHDGRMSDVEARIAALLHEAGETHHLVFRIVDGADDDWASWYADWLVNHSELPELLGVRPVRSELVYVLVGLDKEFTEGTPTEPWPEYYATRVLRHFS